MINQYSVYRVNRRNNGLLLWRLKYIDALKLNVPIQIENYRHVALFQVESNETIAAISRRIVGSKIHGIEDPIGVSDVLVFNRDGEIKCYYIDQNRLMPLVDFIRFQSSGAVIDLDTENIKVEDLPGTWRSTDMLLFLGNEYYLMENQQFPDNAANIIVDAYGKYIAENMSGRFDEEAKQRIREAVQKAEEDSKKKEDKRLEEQKTIEKYVVPAAVTRLLTYQKPLENGTFERSTESGTEQNYDMVDGRVNNGVASKKQEAEPKRKPPAKKKHPKKRESVIGKLRMKQFEIAKRSGKEVPLYLQKEAERNRK